MKKDYQTHVFTSTYTADVSGVCSAMYELGGMTVLHDPSGCNSTYSTHDEPRWYDSNSLMFVSGLDEITAVMGDDSVLIRDVVQAAADLHPRFITLCGASIPHIIAFDYKGVANLIERECHLPVLPVPTDGLRSYISGVDLAFRTFVDRFCDPTEYRDAPEKTINLIGVTPLDFSINGNVAVLRKTFEDAGFTINTCMAMGDTFEQVSHAYGARCNVVVSSAGRKTARFMKKKSGMPYVEGLPIGPDAADRLIQAVRDTLSDGLDRMPFEDIPPIEDVPSIETITSKEENCEDHMQTNNVIVVIGEEIYAKSLVYGINALQKKNAINTANGTASDALTATGDASTVTAYSSTASAFWPDVDEGIAEEDLIRVMRAADTVIADPLYQVVARPGSPRRFIGLPHEAYSGRIFRKQIPVFAGRDYNIKQLLKEK